MVIPVGFQRGCLARSHVTPRARLRVDATRLLAKGSRARTASGAERNRRVTTRMHEECFASTSTSLGSPSRKRARSRLDIPKRRNRTAICTRAARVKARASKNARDSSSCDARAIRGVRNDGRGIISYNGNLRLIAEGSSICARRVTRLGRSHEEKET